MAKRDLQDSNSNRGLNHADLVVGVWSFAILALLLADSKPESLFTCSWLPTCMGKLAQPTNTTLRDKYNRDRSRGQLTTKFSFFNPLKVVIFACQASCNMPWYRWELGEKAIFYDMALHSGDIPATLLPRHVEALRRSMLDFSCAILNFQDIPDNPTEARQGNHDADPALTAAHKTLNKATAIHQGGYSEKKWEAFFQSECFEPLAHSISIKKDDSRRYVECSTLWRSSV